LRHCLRPRRQREPEHFETGTTVSGFGLEAPGLSRGELSLTDCGIRLTRRHPGDTFYDALPACVVASGGIRGTVDRT
jgi:hypothetical protein